MSIEFPEICREFPTCPCPIRHFSHNGHFGYSAWQHIRSNSVLHGLQLNENIVHYMNPNPPWCSASNHPFTFLPLVEKTVMEKICSHGPVTPFYIISNIAVIPL